MDWPAKRSDLSVSKKVWAVLALCVYRSARQLKDVEDLAKVVILKWNKSEAGAIKTYTTPFLR